MNWQYNYGYIAVADKGYVLFATIHENTLSKTEVARSEGSGQQTGGREIESKK